MSGHSKWSQIKRQKAKTDAAKGATFSKVAREIIVATRTSGTDPEQNFRLRTAIDKAKICGFPNDNIKRAILKGSGGLECEALEELTYEGYGPDGVAVLVLAMTDNRNRTASDLRFYFSKNGGNLGENGCANFLFEKKGVITLNKENVKDGDELLLIAADAGADDIKESDDIYEVLTSPDEVMAVEQGLKKDNFTIESTEISFLPINTIEISDAETAKKILKLLDMLESHDDVQQVFSNADIKDEFLE